MVDSVLLFGFHKGLAGDGFGLVFSFLSSGLDSVLLSGPMNKQ